MSEYFPPDVLFQIFLNLPPKTLRRFLSVSQLWYSIISSTLFVSQHLVLPPHPQNNSFFFLKHRNLFSEEKHEEFLFYLDQETQNQETHYQENPNQETQNQEIQNQETQNQENQNQETLDKESSDTLGVPCEIRYPPIVGSAGFNRIIGIENGLIIQIDDFGHENPSPYLWNPAVDVFVKLPNPKIANPNMYAFGFWFDSRDCDFKVMWISYRLNKEVEAGYDLPPLAEVYSLNTGEWGRVNVDGVKCYMPERSWSYVNLNGRLHWIGYKYYPLHCLILSFDVNDGVFREIMLPYGLVTTMIAFDLKITETKSELGPLRLCEGATLTRA